mgnify:CR=1 FL=1
MTRQQFESELTGEMVAAGIDPAVAARHVQQFWNGTGYSDPDLQQKWQQHCRTIAKNAELHPVDRLYEAIALFEKQQRCRTCALPDDCASCPHAGEAECCGGAV